MTPTERIEQFEAELKELKEQVRHEADPVVDSGEFFGMSYGYIFPVPDRKSGGYKYSLAAEFNENKQNRDDFGCAEDGNNKLKIYKVSRHKSGKFSVEDTGKVFDPWAEQRADFKPIGDLDLKVGDKVEIKLKTNISRLDPGTLLPVNLEDLGWVQKSTLARKVSP